MGYGNSRGIEKAGINDEVRRDVKKWQKPIGGLVKVNVDGALDSGMGLFGTGDVVRDDTGRCVGVLAVPGRAS